MTHLGGAGGGGVCVGTGKQQKGEWIHFRRPCHFLSESRLQLQAAAPNPITLSTTADRTINFQIS